MNHLALSLLLLAGLTLIPRAGHDIKLRLNPGEMPKTPRDGPDGKPAPRSRVHSLINAVVKKTAPEVDPLIIAGDIELFVACLRAGLSIQQATNALSLVAGDETSRYWTHVSSLLALGVEPDRAWQQMHQVPGFSDLARLVTLSEDSGAAIASGCQRLVDTLRSDATSQAVAKAERAGVFISLPLALCFLPAFIVLGLVPVVISLGSQLL